jgi:hypothetical protein
MVARAADYLTVRRLRCDERTTGSHCFIEEGAEHIRFVTIPSRMLLPNQWVSGHSEQRIEVVAAERAEIEQPPAQYRLKIRSQYS